MNNLAYKDEPFCETISGKTVMMSPRPNAKHNGTIRNLTRIFSTFLRGKRCRLFVDGIDVHLDDENTFVPDLAIVCDRGKIKDDGIHGAPDLVVEVLSLSTMTRDRGVKKDAYERVGVREYWIVNPESESVEVYHLKDGRFVLDHAYVVFPEWEWERMNEKERAEARLSVKVSLYDDLLVDIREVFEDI